MYIEIITDKMPACGLGIGGNDGLHMRQEIRLGARRSAQRSQEFATDHVPAGIKTALSIVSF